MITDLTQAQIDKLLSGPGDTQSKLILEKFGFSWNASATAVPDNVSAIGLYDSNTVIVLAINENSIDYWRWDGTTVTSGSYDIGAPPGNLGVADGEKLGYFTHNNGLYAIDLTTGATTLKTTPSSTIVKIGVAAKDKVHFVFRHSDSVSRLGCWNGTDIIMSEVYWPYAINTFDAKAREDHDVVLISGEGIPYQAAEAQGINAAWTIKKTTMVATLIYINERYSDHYTVATGETDINHIVRNANMFVTPQSVGIIYESDAYGNNMLAITMSTYGRAWEIPTPLRFPPTDGQRSFFAVTDDRMYCCNDGVMYSSHANYRVSVHNPNVQMDVTDLILGGSLNLRVKAGLSGLKLFGSTELMDFLADQQPVMLIFEIGYHYADESIRTAVFLGESNTISYENSPSGGNVVTINATDVLAWLDRKSGYFVEIPALTGGHDDYRDNTKADTNYGGMTHTVAVEGSWNTPLLEEKRVLEPTEFTGGRVVAFSTFVPDALNGFCQAWYKYDSASEEMVGLLARGVAAYILTQATWNPDSGTAAITHYPGTRNTSQELESFVLASVSASLANEAWLRYQVRYALHRMYYSTDGVNYSLLLEAISEKGAFPGHFGVVGKIPEPKAPWEPPDDPGDPPGDPEWPPPPWEPPVEEEQNGGIVAFVIHTENKSYTTKIYITRNIGALNPTWIDISPVQGYWHQLPGEEEEWLMRYIPIYDAPFSLQFGTRTSHYWLYLSGYSGTAVKYDPFAAYSDYHHYHWEPICSDYSPDDCRTGGRVLQSPNASGVMLMFDPEGTRYLGGDVDATFAYKGQSVKSKSTYAGFQRIPASRYLSWYDNENEIFAGHSILNDPAGGAFNFSSSGEPGDRTYFPDAYQKTEKCPPPRPGNHCYNGGAITLDFAARENDEKAYYAYIKLYGWAEASPDTGGGKSVSIKITATSNKVHPGSCEPMVAIYNSGDISWECSKTFEDKYVFTTPNMSKTVWLEKEFLLRCAGKHMDEYEHGARARIQVYYSALGMHPKWEIHGYWVLLSSVDAKSGSQAGNAVYHPPYGDTVPMRVLHNTIPVGYSGNLEDLECGNCQVANYACCTLPSNDVAIAVCPNWAVAPLARLRNTGWIMSDPTPGGNGYNYISFDELEGPCKWAGNYEPLDIPITITSAGHNIAQRNGLFAAISKNRAYLYLSDDGFATHDTAIIPTDVIGDPYPGIDIMYINSRPYVTLYGQNGVLLYDWDNGIFINKTGNLDMPDNSFKGETWNGITAIDSNDTEVEI